MQVITIGLDIAKRVFQAHSADAVGKAMLRYKLQRAQVLAFFPNLSPCLVGIEACGTAHHWAREIRALCHEARLMPAGSVVIRPAWPNGPAPVTAPQLGNAPVGVGGAEVTAVAGLAGLGALLLFRQDERQSRSQKRLLLLLLLALCLATVCLATIWVLLRLIHGLPALLR